jgi:hypothetical protein
MNWKAKFSILLIISIPAFSGFPLNLFQKDIIPGITYGWVGYWTLVYFAILLLVGGKLLANALALATLITIPVVFVGSAISYLIYLLGIGSAAGPFSHAPHYITLCITMLTVIPLALCLVAVVPFHEFEYSLLRNKTAVSRVEKFCLMFVRVFNHIIYAVIPNILETVQEERHYKHWVDETLKSDLKMSFSHGSRSIKSKLIALVADMIQIGVEGICASIQYIPMWAVEISQLPGKSENGGLRPENSEQRSEDR